MSKHTCRFLFPFIARGGGGCLSQTIAAPISLCTPPPSLFPSPLCLAHLFYACIVCESVHVESLHSECEFHALPPGLCGFRKNWPSLSLLLHLLLGLISQLRPHPGQPLAHSDCSDSLVPAFSVVLSAAAEVNVTMLVIHVLSLLRGSTCLFRSSAKCSIMLSGVFLNLPLPQLCKHYYYAWLM